MKRLAAALLIPAIIVLGVGGIAHMAAAQTVGPIEPAPPGGCGGNSTIRTLPIDCGNARTYTIQGVTFTVTVRLQVDATGNGTATYTLSRRLPQPVPIRVRAHTGISSGPTVHDVSGEIPAGALTATLTVRVICGQVDVKAVFTAPGDERGRIAGPYLCVAGPPTTPTTAPTTIPDTTPTTGATTSPTTPTSGPGTAPVTTTGTTPASVVPSTTGGRVSVGSTIPRTGPSVGDIFGWGIVVTLLGVLVVVTVATNRNASKVRQP